MRMNLLFAFVIFFKVIPEGIALVGVFENSPAGRTAQRHW
jgi:hypothetical protein